MPFGFLAVVIVLGLIVLFRWINVLNEYERAVVFRLGRMLPQPKGPGLVLHLLADRAHGQNLAAHRGARRAAAGRHHPRQRLGQGQRGGLLPRRRPQRAVVEVENYLYATSQLAQTTLRSVLGQAELDELLSEREKLNDELQEIIDRQTDPWGIKVSMVEVKHVDLPQEMQRAMARQAEAEREKRAKIIHAEGELQAAMALAEAADVMSRNPITLQLRYLQTLTEIAAEKNSTIIFPLPIDIITPFLGGLRNQSTIAPPER